jgi:pimeloyl-ACP methyl ester carboxylesterase
VQDTKLLQYSFLFILWQMIATTKRAIELLGGPTILVGHSYGGIVITNAGYNNPNVKGLVYVAAFAPNEDQSVGDFFDVSKLPKDFLKTLCVLTFDINNESQCIMV